MLNIRAETEADLEVLLDLAEAFMLWFRRIDPDAVAVDRAKFEQSWNALAFCAEPHLFALIAEVEGKAVGYAFDGYGLV